MLTAPIPSPGKGLWGAINAGSYTAAKLYLEQGADPNENIAPYLTSETTAKLSRNTKSRGDSVNRYMASEGDVEPDSMFTYFHLVLFDAFLNDGGTENRQILEAMLDHNADVSIHIRNIALTSSHFYGIKPCFYVVDDTLPIDLVVLLGKFNEDEAMQPTIELLAQATREAARTRLLFQDKQIVSKSVVDGWSNQLYSKDFSDVTFVCPDGTELHAHRSTLAAASSYFHASFLGPWKESQKDGRWETTNSSTVMKAVLRFVYTGEMELSLDDLNCAVELLKIANEYGLAGLLRLCEANLIPKLTTKNIKGRLQLANLCGAEHLLNACYRFIRCKATEVLTSPKFAALAVEDPDLWAKLEESISPSRERKRKRDKESVADDCSDKKQAVGDV